MISKDGRYVWIRDEAVLVRDEEGRPLFWQGVISDVTGRKEAEARLREAEERYRTLVEQIPAVTYMDVIEAGGSSGTFRTTYMSPQVKALLGYTPEEFESSPDVWISLLHPEDRERALAGDAHHYATGEPLSQEHRMIARDGRVVWVRDEARIIRGERATFSHGVLFDITERKEAEARLREVPFPDRDHPGGNVQAGVRRY